LNLNAVSENYQELSPPWHHDTVLNKAADGADNPKMWGKATNMFNNQWLTTKKGRLSIFAAG